MRLARQSRAAAEHGRVEEAADVGAQLAEFYVQRPEAGRQLELGEQVVEVGYMLMSRGLDTQAFKLFQLVVDRFAAPMDARERELLAAAQLHFVIALIYVGDPTKLPDETTKLQEMGEESLPAIDQLVSRLSGRPARRFDLAAALENKIGILLRLSRADEARIVLRDLVAQFDGDDSPQTQMMLTVLREELADLL